ncbi:MAG: trypsin-like serine protease, partial [Clostridiales bacterium]|nr:trypsin-like serine protease [Clostridiales bacterium]
MMKRILSMLLIAMMALTAACAEQAEQQPADETVGYDAIYSPANPIPGIAQRVRPSVVDVTCSVENWDSVTREASVTPIGAGSGCFIRTKAEGDGGYILTNYHVVGEADEFTLRWLDGTEMEATVVGYDDGTDIAVLEFKDPVPEGVSPIPIGDSDALQIGELAIVIGNPGSSEETLYSTVTAGIISGVERSAEAGNFSRSVNVIQTDAAINVGNSGGALLNAKGELVGIPTLKYMYSYDTVYEGLGFCIPINAVVAFVDQIIDTGVVVRPRMGMTVAAAD